MHVQIRAEPAFLVAAIVRALLPSIRTGAGEQCRRACGADADRVMVLIKAVSTPADAAKVSSHD